MTKAEQLVGFRLIRKRIPEREISEHTVKAKSNVQTKEYSTRGMTSRQAHYYATLTVFGHPHELETYLARRQDRYFGLLQRMAEENLALDIVQELDHEDALRYKRILEVCLSPPPYLETREYTRKAYTRKAHTRKAHTITTVTSLTRYAVTREALEHRCETVERLYQRQVKALKDKKQSPLDEALGLAKVKRQRDAALRKLWARLGDGEFMQLDKNDNMNTGGK